VKAPPGSAVSAKVGSDAFGPVKAGARGEAVVPIVAPPGVRQATVTITGGSRPLVREVALEVPPYNRLTAAVVPGAAPAGGQGPARLDVYYDSGGADVPADRVRVSPSEGEVALVESGQGRFSYRYDPAPRSAGGEVRFQIGVEGDPAAAAAASLALPAPAPTAAASAVAAEATPPIAEARSERAAPARLRVDGHRILVGPRVGFTHSSGDLSGARLGVDAWVPVRVGPALFGLGLSLSRATAAQTVAGPGGTLVSSSAADFYPLAARLGYELWAGRRLSFTVGGGFTVAYARFTSTLGGADSGWGSGPLGFAAAACAIGPGQLFAEVSASRAPIATPDFKLEAGGLAIEAGYRLGIR
jgi:hypothetical protein